MNEKRLYRISPSLLNAFDGWLNAGEDWDKFWGESDLPPVTREGYERGKLEELLGYINGVAQEPSEAADRGTCLNEIVDCLLGNRPRGDVRWSGSDGFYKAVKGDFTFLFDRGLVDSLTLMLQSSVAQYHLDHAYDFEGGRIRLHGYADYIFPTMIWDLKTTGKYTTEKYAQNWQRHVYPVVAVDSGELVKCEKFTFYALECTKDRKSGVITGKAFAESYDVNLVESRERVLEYVRCVVVPWLDRWERDGLINGSRVVRALEPESLGAAGDMVSHRKGGAE